MPVKAMEKLAGCAVNRLKIGKAGLFSITFVSSSRMRRLNSQFLRHDWVTDVLSFRYNGEAVVGEVLIAPREAKRYAKRNSLSYRQELSRYVVHGLLHWMGHQDRTVRQKQRMRRLEEELLKRCGVTG